MQVVGRDNSVAPKGQSVPSDSLFLQQEGLGPSILTFDRFSHSFDDLVRDIFSFALTDPTTLRERNFRPTRYYETTDDYVTEVELPGFKREQVKVSTKNNVVTVKADNGKSTFKYDYSLSLADLNKLTAKLEDGILTVRVPKTPEAKEKIIDVS